MIGTESAEPFVGNKVGDTIQLKVLAHWKDGTVEDVTGFTRFDTNDESVATVNSLGEVKIVGAAGARRHRR